MESGPVELSMRFSTYEHLSYKYMMESVNSISTILKLFIQDANMISNRDYKYTGQMGTYISVLKESDPKVEHIVENLKKAAKKWFDKHPVDQDLVEK